MWETSFRIPIASVDSIRRAFLCSTTKRAIKPAVPIRWKYTDEANVEEIAARRRIVSRIDDWWSAFRKNADKIDAHYEKGEKFEIVEFTSKELKLIHPELFWEYGPALEGKGHRLVITPETGRHLRPLVDAILARPPVCPGGNSTPTVRPKITNRRNAL